MNKGRRNELKMLKFKRRLIMRKLTLEDVKKPNYNLHAFRSHGAPCSCWACSPADQKYNRARQKDKFSTNAYIAST